MESTNVVAVAVEKPRYKSVVTKQGVATYTHWDGKKVYIAQARLAGWIGPSGEMSRSQKFDTMRDARAWLGKALTEMRAQGPQEQLKVVPTKVKLADLFASYVAKRDANGTLSGSISYMFKRLAKHEMLKDVLASNANGKLAMEYCTARRDGFGDSKPVDPSTIAPEFVRAAMAMREMGREHGWPKYDPWGKDVRESLVEAGLIDDSDERNRRPSGEEMDAMMAVFAQWEAANVVPMADIVSVAVMNAFRRKEITGLRWSDLDVTHSAIFCWNRKDSSRKARRRDKDGVLAKKGSRTLVPLFPEVLEILLRQPRAAHILLGRPTAGVVPGSKEDLIFPHSDDLVGQRWTDARKRVIEAMPHLAGIADLRFHDLRHEAISTFAPLMASSDAMMISGHKTERSFRRYINQTQEDAKRIAMKGAHIKVRSANRPYVVPLVRAA